ncbi:MAG: thioredoxin fold domain-containing protein [Burkholderiales bacterium]|nr:MAG: thioredoxin fold domain-containing protein [Burkholderiales bacterium]
MKRAIAVLCIATLTALWSQEVPAQAPSPHAIDIPDWFVDTFLELREDVADAAGKGKRLLIYFGQDGCPYCKLLMETTFRETRLADKVQRGFLPLALNMWGDREVTWVDGRRMSEKELARALKVQYTPTLLMFNEQAEVIVRLNGYLPAHQLEAAIDYVAGRLETKRDLSEYVRAAAGPPASPRLHDEPYFLAAPYDLTGLRGKRLVVLFERPNCASCDELHLDTLKRDEVARWLTEFTVARFDPGTRTALTTPDGRQTNAAAWARELGIAYVPTLVFFDTSGAEVFRAEAYLRAFHLSSALEYVASDAYRSEPSFQRFVQARADRMREHGRTVDLWK